MSPPKVQEVRSPNGQLSVRVVTGGVWGRFAEGQHATAEWYELGSGIPRKVRTAALLNPVAPHSFRITDDGVLVILEDYCNFGNGDNVVVIYSPSVPASSSASPRVTPEHRA